jgi:hypothetical protein
MKILLASWWYSEFIINLKYDNNFVIIFLKFDHVFLEMPTLVFKDEIIWCLEFASK